MTHASMIYNESSVIKWETQGKHKLTNIRKNGMNAKGQSVLAVLKGEMNKNK